MLALRALAQGEGVYLAQKPTVVTPQEAANYLGVSRPTVMKRIQSGELPARREGSRHVVDYEQLVEYRRRDAQRKGEVLRKMMELEEDWF